MTLVLHSVLVQKCSTLVINLFPLTIHIRLWAYLVMYRYTPWVFLLVMYNEVCIPHSFSFHFLFSCTQNNEQHQISEEVVLARVGHEVITIQDFIRRAEYAIRPDYCRQDNYIHKKIVLNSLIGEKLTALEQESMLLKLKMIILILILKAERNRQCDNSFMQKNSIQRLPFQIKRLMKLLSLQAEE